MQDQDHSDTDLDCTATSGLVVQAQKDKIRFKR